MNKTYIPNILVYLIYHDNASYKIVARYKKYNYIRLFYNESTKYFESNIFKYLSGNKNEWINKDYVGILTYSFEKKIFMNLDNIYNKIIEILNNNPDCKLITFYHGILQNRINSIYFHGKIKEIFDHTLSEFGIEVPVDYSKITPFYRNYWLTTSELMAKYIDFALEYMKRLDDESDLFLQVMVNSNAKYNGVLSKEKLLKITGFPYYTNHCFVMERLPCIFFWKDNIEPYKLQN